MLLGVEKLIWGGDHGSIEREEEEEVKVEYWENNA